MRSIYLMVLVAASVGACEPAPAHRHPDDRRVTERSRLEPWMNPPAARGLYFIEMGMGGRRWISIDTETRQLESREIPMFQHEPRPPPISRTLSAAEMDQLWTLAEDAWRAAPPSIEHATDFRGVIVAADHDETLLIDYDGSLGPGPALRLKNALGHAASWPGY